MPRVGRSHFEAYTDQNRAKHAILTQYFNAYLTILRNTAAAFHYVDGFAGPGSYGVDIPGSPLQVIRLLARQPSLGHPPRKQLIDSERVSVQNSCTLNQLLSEPPMDASPNLLSGTIDATLRRRAHLDRLEAQITELWGHLNAATYKFLVLIAELDRSKAHERHGLVSTAQWLNWQCGIGKVAAREKVRVARALEALPEISTAFASGEFSYSKVRAM